MTTPRNFTGRTLSLVTSIGLLTLLPVNALQAEIRPVNDAETRVLDNGGNIPVDIAVDGLFTNGELPLPDEDVIVIDQHACELLAERGHSGFLYYPGRHDEQGNILSLVRWVTEAEEQVFYQQQRTGSQPPAGNPAPII